jgi:hypothetical protein
MSPDHVLDFAEVGLKDVGGVGGKTASRLDPTI